jgi:hypothetical protein
VYKGAVTVTITGATAAGPELEIPALGSGARRGTYAPHTEAGYRAPANKTLLLLLNGLLAKRGVRAARRTAA